MSYPFWIADPNVRAIQYAQMQAHERQRANERRERVFTYLRRERSGRPQPMVNDARDWPLEALDQLSAKRGIRPYSIEAHWRQDVPNGAGIYFLWIDEELVYIGQSINLRSRLRTHRRYSERAYAPWNPLGWTHATWVAVPEDTLNNWEVSYIAKYLPRFNILLRKQLAEAVVQTSAKPPLSTTSVSAEAENPVAY